MFEVHLGCAFSWLLHTGGVEDPWVWSTDHLSGNLPGCHRGAKGSRSLPAGELSLPGAAWGVTAESSCPTWMGFLMGRKMPWGCVALLAQGITVPIQIRIQPCLLVLESSPGH